MGRPLGSTNRVISRGRIQDVVTPEQYKALIDNLINLALNARNDRDKIAATKIIIEYVEGRSPQRIEVANVDAMLTIKDILRKDNDNE